MMREWPPTSWTIPQSRWQPSSASRWDRPNSNYASSELLLFHHQQCECSRLYGAARTVTLLGRRSFFNLSRHQVNTVGISVQGHGTGKLLRLGVFHHTELVRRVLM